MRTFAVYKIHNIITNKDYISISSNPIGRINAHENSPYPIGCTIRKYGWENFEVDILYLVKTREEACKLEIDEIKKHNCKVPNGYNLTDGGDNPPSQKGKKRKPRSKEYCKKQSESKKGNKNFEGHHHTKVAKRKMRYAHIGIKPSKESKEKNRQAHLNKKHTKEAKEKMRKNSNAHSVQSEIKRLKTRLAKLEVNK